MLGLGNKHNEEKPAPAPVDLRLTFERDGLTITGEGLPVFRLSREDAIALADGSAARRFRNAEAAVDKREWTDESRALFAKIGRLLKTHELSFAKIGRVLGQGEAELRELWAWGVNARPLEHMAQDALDRALASDDVDLIPERVRPWGLNPGVAIKQTRLTGPRVIEALERGSVRAAAAALGVSEAALDAWIDRNAELLRVLS